MVNKLACSAALALFLLACTQVGGAQQSTPAVSTSVPALIIGAGDLIQVSMYQNPDLSGQYRVNEQGDITVPLLGKLHVAGKTADEVGALVEKGFVDAQILQPAESHASVFISEYASQGIIINGEVKTPGVYPALGVRMLNDIVAAAGGENPTAASKVVITHRNDPGNPLVVEYNPSALSPIVPQVQVFPGDSIMIPRAGIVYVLGNVARSGGYVLDGRRALTVESVMALAGGGGHAAALKRVQLVRTLEDGRREAITIPVNLIYKGQAPDVALVDGDILYVPTSNVRLAAEQALQSALQIGSSVAIYKTAVQ